jgi:hypothetical protein
MDDPQVKWTIADIFASPPRLAMVYHVMGTSYDVFNPVGAIAGSLFGTVSLLRNKSAAIDAASKSRMLLKSIANGGLIGGALGITLGLAALYGKSRQGEKLEPLPWNEDGIQTRVSGIRHNYKIRTLDLYVWSGIAVGALSHSVRNTMNRPKVGLSLLQAISLGSTVGSISGIATIVSTEYFIRKTLNELQDD